MPRLGSSVIDEHGLQLVHDWIEQLAVVDPEDGAGAASVRAEVASTLRQLTDQKASSTSALSRSSVCWHRPAPPCNWPRRGAEVVAHRGV